MRKWLTLALVIVLADQIVKYVIVQKFALHESLYVTSFFNLVYVRNTGAAFSLFADASGWQRYFFVAVAVIASVWVVWLLKKHPNGKMFCLALSTILGGAVGNLIDRVLFGSVVDFVQVHYAGYYFPAFNVADSCITIGAGLLLLDAVLDGRKAKAAGPEGSA